MIAELSRNQDAKFMEHVDCTEFAAKAQNAKHNQPVEDERRESGFECQQHFDAHWSFFV